MTTNTIINRFEIFFYSALISALSGLNHLRTGIQAGPVIQGQKYTQGVTGDIQPIDRPEPGSFARSWASFKAALLPLILWTVLGFAAGFLIGMLSPR